MTAQLTLASRGRCDNGPPCLSGHPRFSAGSGSPPTSSAPASNPPARCTPFLSFICTPAAWLIVRYHVRSRDGFLASTTLTTFGTVITLVVAYFCTFAGAAVTVWFSEMVTSTDIRVGSLAVTSALSMIAAVVGFVWRCLK